MLGLFIFAQGDAEVWQNFMLYVQQPQFISMVVILILLIAIPLYVLTYWFYGKQAERMAAKMIDQS
jgi:Tfp pilus assembly protein PilX